MATVQYRKECSLVLLKEEIKARDLSLLENVLRVASLSISKSVRVDCGHVAAVPAEALGRLLALSRKAEALGVSLLFCRVCPAVERAIQESGLEVALRVAPSLADIPATARTAGEFEAVAALKDMLLLR